MPPYSSTTMARCSLRRRISSSTFQATWANVREFFDPIFSVSFSAAVVYARLYTHKLERDRRDRRAQIRTCVLEDTREGVHMWELSSASRPGRAVSFFLSPKRARVFFLSLDARGRPWSLARSRSPRSSRAEAPRSAAAASACNLRCGLLPQRHGDRRSRVSCLPHSSISKVSRVSFASP